MLKKSSLSLLLILFVAQLTNAQSQFTLDGNTSMVLREFNAVLTEVEGKVNVRMVLGGQKKDNTDALKNGDTILMMNGKRFKNVAELKDVFNAIEDGVEVKIGVLRGEEKFILRATKGDFEEMGGGGRTMVMSQGGGAAAAGGATVIPSLGVVLVKEDGKVKIQQVVDMIADPAIKSKGDLAGFIITKLNGEEVNDPAELNKQIDALKTGEEYTLTIAKDGDSLDVTVKKRDTPGMSVRQG